MVYHHKPNPSSGAMKRSASAMEGPPGWDVAPPMMAIRPPRHTANPLNLPFAHYALIYLDKDGKVKTEESASMEDNYSYRSTFTAEVRERFLDMIDESERIQGRQPISRPSPRRVRRRRDNIPVSASASFTEDHAAEDSDSDDISPGGRETTALRIGDTQKIINYYEGALKHFQQLNCRMVAKAFIKFIEPRKQVRHPYNGGKPPAGSAPGTTGDPEKTKPEWWPPGVMHKEPDHLRKEYRIELLLHIIRKLGHYHITADKLKEVAGDTKRSLKHPSHIGIIFEILRVRKMEERYERGEVDGNTLVYVENRGPSPKGDGDGDEEEDSGDVPALPANFDAAERIEEGLLTPSSTVEQAPATLTTPIDNMPVGMPPRSLPGGFSLGEPLTFEGRQDRHFYATPPQYTDSFSQGMLSTPIATEMLSPHEVPVFDYPQNGFPSSTPDQPRGPGYDSWSTPSFRQNIFGPVDYKVDYSAPPSSQPLPHTSMPYGMPMAPPHMHEMSPHAQSPVDPATGRALPFRTGSLGHPHGLPPVTLSHSV
ncbi:hypothetical protein N7532_006538 [Penicillium argentinense]|uniref:Subtelomeric hrmA-associated cluster protein AFUB-079030/YDR124W-like helical bundle domain-containing protein n=1 Tax=Penicillium argentinense TaxID=1131581 RepID=A0A9W9FG19_9EURO|nr:uncharacterized protein N7532_006538 [Penicillium argentinense]KAJ5099537.1 hypothetical protein N7532_006538 [Penicillium argentinense]